MFWIIRDNNLKTRQNNSQMEMQKVCWQLSVKLSKSSHNFVNLGSLVTVSQESWNGQTMKLICVVDAVWETISRLDLWLTVLITTIDTILLQRERCILWDEICGYDTIQWISLSWFNFFGVIKVYLLIFVDYTQY